MADNSKEARARAEARFEKAQKASQEREKVHGELEAEAKAVREKPRAYVPCDSPGKPTTRRRLRPPRLPTPLPPPRSSAPPQRRNPTSSRQPPRRRPRRRAPRKRRLPRRQPRKKLRRARKTALRTPRAFRLPRERNSLWVQWTTGTSPDSADRAGTAPRLRPLACRAQDGTARKGERQWPGTTST